MCTLMAREMKIVKALPAAGVRWEMMRRGMVALRRDEGLVLGRGGGMVRDCLPVPQLDL